MAAGCGLRGERGCGEDELADHGLGFGEASTLLHITKGGQQIHRCTCYRLLPLIAHPSAKTQLARFVLVSVAKTLNPPPTNWTANALSPTPTPGLSTLVTRTQSATLTTASTLVMPPRSVGLASSALSVKTMYRSCHSVTGSASASVAEMVVDGGTNSGPCMEFEVSRTRHR